MVAEHKMDDILPWEDAGEDSAFKYLTIALIIIFFIGAYFLNNVILPEPKRQSLKEVSPRLAQLVIEKKKEEIKKPKPVKKKLIPKKEKPKPKKEKKKPKVKEQPKPKPVEEKKPQPTAKEVAQSSGLLAFADELSDLRDDFDLAELDEPVVNTNATKQAKTVQQDVLTAKATTGSSGIKASGVTKATRATLQQRQTAKVATAIKPAAKLTKKDPEKPNLQQRSEEEIERVFQKNKGQIFTIYNRELRKDPSMRGKIVFSITIEPDGKVSKCIIVSSDIENKKLQKRLISKIKKFKFKPLKVPVITVNYPIDFLPS